MSTSSTPRTTLVAQGLHLSYRVYAQRRIPLGQLFANKARRQQHQTVDALRGVDIEARAGETIGIVGHNGSGKSTLLMTLAGLLPATKGEVWASSQPRFLGVSAVLKSEQSGRQNIVLGGLALGLTREAVREQLPAIVAFSGLEDAIDRPMRTYSSGMRARLHFSIATCVRPEILLLDEALAVGDHEFRRRSWKRVNEIREHAGTVFLVSHSLSEITKTATRAIWLDHGLVQMEGSPKKVTAAYKASQERA